MAPMSRAGSPTRVRLRAARRRRRRKPSQMSFRPLSRGMPPPSATQARLARSTMPKFAVGARAAPPAMTSPAAPGACPAPRVYRPAP
eukprot:5734358-Pleurochrysis_carterae.AAC.1